MAGRIVRGGREEDNIVELRNSLEFHSPRGQNIKHGRVNLKHSTFLYFRPIALVSSIRYNLVCADPETFVRGGTTLTTFCFFFMLMRGEMIQIPLKAGKHRPASETPFQWRFAGVQMIA